MPVIYFQEYLNFFHEMEMEINNNKIFTELYGKLRARGK